MSVALELATRALGETNPNPMVGCVLVKNGRVVGSGHHRRAGGPHAETMALRAAGRRAIGSTLYVNLEPCSHWGRTPPCASAVAEAGVRRVVAALRDPNPLVAGRGLRLLRRAGVEVRLGVLAPEARRLNDRFLLAARLPRPFVLLKAAMTLDGRIATSSGDSKWITSRLQRQGARRLRRLHDAVAVGIGTVLRDDPSLLPARSLRRPFTRVVFDGRLRLPLDSRLVQTAQRCPVVAIYSDAPAGSRSALEARGVTALRAPRTAQGIDLRAALGILRVRGVWSLMVEGGASLLGSFLTSRLFDQVALYRAALLLGGRESLGAFSGEGPSLISEALPMTRVHPPWEGCVSGDSDLLEIWEPRGRRRRGSSAANA
jgi:diaminohydroxyphosphoribosylaminopyrimidine deaminase / 5-amino-6-(5-phosphoribosylamino)uracil reductase